MLQQCPVALAQVKAGSASHNSISEIRQIITFFGSIKRDSEIAEVF